MDYRYLGDRQKSRRWGNSYFRFADLHPPLNPLPSKARQSHLTGVMEGTGSGATRRCLSLEGCRQISVASPRHVRRGQAPLLRAGASPLKAENRKQMTEFSLCFYVSVVNFNDLKLSSKDTESMANPNYELRFFEDKIASGSLTLRPTLRVLYVVTGGIEIDGIHRGGNHR